MAEGETKLPILFKHFFESTAPGLEVIVADAFQERERGAYSSSSRIPDIELYCDNKICQGTRVFKCRNDTVTFYNNESTSRFITFYCRNCEKTEKLYAILGRHSRPEAQLGAFLKLGEKPAFGPPTPRKLLNLIQEDLDLFLKGKRCEMGGLGIGAFVYYRRIVENQKHKVFDALVKACLRLKTDPELIAELEAAKKETQFTRAVDVIRHALPPGLLINNENPLLLLHEALSEGVHGLSDEECLELAIVIRTVLASLSERLTQVTADDAEMQTAASKLAARRAAKSKQVSPPPSNEEMS